MSERTHEYDVTVTWTGDRGTGTSGYRDFNRAHDVTADGPAPIAGSADPAFRGDPSRWNPEQELVATGLRRAQAVQRRVSQCGPCILDVPQRDVSGFQRTLH